MATTSAAFEEMALSRPELTVSKDAYCIIGAGPAGLAAARCLTERGIAVDVLERHSDVGGIWDSDNPRSPVYDSAHFISSKTISGFTELGFPDSVPEYPSRHDVLALVRAYADRYDLRRWIEFSTHVLGVEPQGERWVVRVQGGTPRSYRGVVLASGFQWTPNEPAYPGTGDFAGEIFHSVRYRTPHVFEGRRVLVVGCGASGVDVASDATTRARTTLLSMRRGHHFLPKHLLGRPTDLWGGSGGGVPIPFRVRQRLLRRLLRVVYGDLTRYGVPAPDHEILERPPILSSHLLDHLSHGRIRPKPDLVRLGKRSAFFADGSREDVDVVVFCTGYRECWPYLDERFLPSTGGGDLFLNVFHRRYDDLFVAGLLRSNAGGYAVFERQAQLIARAIAAGPEERAKLRGYKRAVPRASARYAKNEYQSSYFDADSYRRDLERLRRVMAWS